MPTFRTKDREAVIDITLTNRRDLVIDWKVAMELSFSDHSRISFSLSLEKSERKPYRNPRRTDWDSYRYYVDRELTATLGGRKPPEGVEQLVGCFTSIAVRGFEEACPVSYPGKREQPKWWTSEISIQRSTVRRLFNRAKITRREEDWNSYRVSFNKYKGDIKRAKRTTWISFCESLDSVNEFSRFRRILSRNPAAPGYIQRTDNSWTESSSESLNLLLDTHFPGCTDLEVGNRVGESGPLSALLANRENREIVEGVVTMERVKWAINTFEPYKSPGPDGLIPAMLQNIADQSLLLLVRIFRMCLGDGYIPIGWREVRVVFIPKAGKTGHSKPKDYRPISLSSFLLKTLERLIDLYLRTKIDASILSNAQHAYLKGRSVESALLDVVGYIERGLQFREFTLAAFLDIEGAFNNIRIEAIRQSLVDLNIQNFLIEWIVQMLSKRIIISSMGDVCLRKRVTRGTPQGGVLSPLLWLVAVNSLLRQFDREGRKVVAYADDVVLLVTGKFLPTISDVMQVGLNRLSAWARDRGLGINPSKTELVLFTRKYKVETFRLPTLEGVELRLSGMARYLGVFLDSKLSWEMNTQERLRKGLNAYYACRTSIGKNWGLRPMVVEWLYTSVVRPILAYGCCVWWQALGLSSRRNILSKAQRCASLGITGALRSTPQAALDVILHLLPIEEYVKGMAVRSLIRLNELGHVGAYRAGLGGILREIDFGDHSLDRPGSTDYMNAELDFGDMPALEIPSRESWVGVGKLFRGFAVFTDGSKMEAGTGAGVYMEEGNIGRSYRLPDGCSVFQAEILGIFKATELIGELLRKGSEVTIYVDSQAALKALKGICVRSRLVRDCKRALRSIMRDYTVRLCWVPGHCDIVGNERADELARLGSAQDGTTGETCVKPSLGFFFGRIRDWVRDRTNNAWRSRSDCAVSRTLWPSLSKTDSKTLLCMDKGGLRALIGILTGHCLIGRMAMRLGAGTSDVCRMCGDEEEMETVEHILCHCPMLQSRRLRWLGSRFLDGLDEVPGCGLQNLQAFVQGIAWLRNTRLHLHQ